MRAAQHAASSLLGNGSNERGFLKTILTAAPVQEIDFAHAVFPPEQSRFRIASHCRYWRTGARKGDARKEKRPDRDGGLTPASLIMR
jgi:hypothetical protein